MDLTQGQLDALNQPIRNKRIRIELLNDELKAINSIEGYVIDGKITANANNTIRRTGNLSLSIPIGVNETTFLDNSAEDILVFADDSYWIDKLLKIYIGIDDLLTENINTTWYKLGVFLMDNPVRNFSATEYAISFNLADQSIKLNGNRQGQLTGTGTIIEKGKYITSDKYTLSNTISLENMGVMCTIKPDGSQVVFGIGYFDVDSIEIYKYANGLYTKINNPATLPTNIITDIKFRPDGLQLAIATKTEIYIYDCTTIPYTYLNKFVITQSELHPILAIGFSPDSSLFVCTRQDSINGPIALYSTSTVPYSFKNYIKTNNNYKLEKIVFAEYGSYILGIDKLISNHNRLVSLSVKSLKEVSLFPNEFNTMYSNVIINDLDISQNGDKVTVLIDRFPYVVSFSTFGTPYQILGTPKEPPDKEYKHCLYYGNGEKLLLVNEIISGTEGILLYDTKTNFYERLPSPLQSSTISDFEVMCIDNYSNDIIIGGRELLSNENKPVYAINYSISLRNLFVSTKTRDALETVINELTFIKKYTISNIPKAYENLPFDIKVGTGSTVEDILKNFKDILSTWQFYFDLDGIYRIEAIPSGENELIFPLDYNTYLKNQLSNDYKNVKNQVVVYGKPNTVSYYTENESIINSYIVPQAVEYSQYWLADKYNFEIYVKLMENLNSYTGNSLWTSIAIGLDSYYQFQNFFMVSDNSSTIAYSVDGINWNYLENALPLIRHWSKSINYGSLRVIIAGKVDTHISGPTIIYSTDGINWELATLPTGLTADIGYLADIVRGDFYLYTIINNSTVSTKSILYSNGGSEWELKESTDAVRGLNCLTYSSKLDRYVALSEFGGGIYWDGQNGATHSFSSTISNQISLAYGTIINNEGNEVPVFISIGENGTGGYSNDGINWKTIKFSKQANYYIVKYIDDSFIVLSDKWVFTSKNGLDWNPIPKELGTNLGLASYQGKIIAPTYGYNEILTINKDFSIITPQENQYYQVIGPNNKVYIWDGTKYNETSKPASNVEYIDNTLELTYDIQLDLSSVLVKVTQFGFLTPKQYNMNNISNLKLNFGGHPSTSGNDSSPFEEYGTIVGSENLGILKVVANNKIFIGLSVSNGIYYSQDGLNWNLSNVSTSFDFSDIYNYDNVFYDEVNDIWILGWGTTLYRSKDGMEWTSISSWGSHLIYKITKYNGTYFIGTTSGLYITMDLETFNAASIPNNSNQIVIPFPSINAGIMALSRTDSSVNNIFYSATGSNWEQLSFDSISYPTTIMFGNGLWVASANSTSGQSRSFLYYSTNSGQSWIRTLTLDSINTTLYYANNRWFAYAMLQKWLYTSLDGKNWESVSLSNTNPIGQIMFNDFWVLTTNLATTKLFKGAVYYSINGIDWKESELTSNTTAFSTLCYKDNVWVVGGMTSFEISAPSGSIVYTSALYYLKNVDSPIISLSGKLIDFENISGYVPINSLEPDTIYSIRISNAEVKEDETVNTDFPITFELYSRQQPSSCLVDTNKESPFYINKGLLEPNYYAGLAKTDIGYNIGENYRLILNNINALTSLENGTLITFMANYSNLYAAGINYTTISVASSLDLSNNILSRVPLVRNELIQGVWGPEREPVSENKLGNDYTLHLIKYDKKNNQFIYIGMNPKALPLVLSGGEYDNINSDQLAYERCLWELYSHTNMQNTLTIDVVPNYLLDVNMRIPYNEKMQYPLAIANSQIFEDSYYLTKQVTYQLGISNTGSQVTALKIYDSGNLLPE